VDVWMKMLSAKSEAVDPTMTSLQGIRNLYSRNKTQKRLYYKVQDITTVAISITYDGTTNRSYQTTRATSHELSQWKFEHDGTHPESES
jgi:hypothetical protein